MRRKWSLLLHHPGRADNFLDRPGPRFYVAGRSQVKFLQCDASRDITLRYHKECQDKGHNLKVYGEGSNRMARR
jgi:hypothetical protein